MSFVSFDQSSAPGRRASGPELVPACRGKRVGFVGRSAMTDEMGPGAGAPARANLTPDPRPSPLPSPPWAIGVVLGPFPAKPCAGGAEGMAAGGGFRPCRGDRSLITPPYPPRPLARGARRPGTGIAEPTKNRRGTNETDDARPVFGRLGGSLAGKVSGWPFRASGGLAVPTSEAPEPPTQANPRQKKPRQPAPDKSQPSDGCVRPRKHLIAKTTHPTSEITSGISP